MLTVYVDNFAEWRVQARQLLIQGVQPEQVTWLMPDRQQGFLFEASCLAKPYYDDKLAEFKVPRTFMELAKQVSCHRSTQKWSLLYTALWRIMRGERHLLHLFTDTVVSQLLHMQKAVSRDAHKMKAFVRFKLYEREGKSLYLAWHKPDHNIVEWVAPFFQQRFSVLNWLIITPDGAVGWDGNSLQFKQNLTTLPEALNDSMEELWQTYYRSIFNPARIKLKAMRREMPVRHWQTLPETRMITRMLQEAPARVKQMLQYSEGHTRSASDFLPKELSLVNLRAAAQACKACSLCQGAKQTVFGAGLNKAVIMLIGEQPGAHEDESGMPFVGPAGQLLDQLLVEAGVERERVYLTNTVKHFKYKLQQNMRIQVSPNIREINACKPWLLAEIQLVQPKLIVCLGITAAKALLSPNFHMKQQRGKWQPFSGTQQIMATYHPSAILRVTEQTQRQVIYQHLLQDLSTITGHHLNT